MKYKIKKNIYILLYLLELFLIIFHFLNQNPNCVFHLYPIILIIIIQKFSQIYFN